MFHMRSWVDESKKHDIYIVDYEGGCKLNIDVDSWLNIASLNQPDPIDPKWLRCDIKSFIKDKNVLKIVNSDMHRELTLVNGTPDISDAYIILAKAPKDGYRYYHSKYEYICIKIPESNSAYVTYNYVDSYLYYWRYAHPHRIMDIRDLINDNIKRHEIPNFDFEFFKKKLKGWRE